jgi:hypothetical protein
MVYNTIKLLRWVLLYSITILDISVHRNTEDSSRSPHFILCSTCTMESTSKTVEEFCPFYPTGHKYYTKRHEVGDRCHKGKNFFIVEWFSRKEDKTFISNTGKTTDFMRADLLHSWGYRVTSSLRTDAEVKETIEFDQMAYGGWDRGTTANRKFSVISRYF